MNIGEPVRVHEVAPMAEPIPERVREAEREPAVVEVEEPVEVEVPR